MKKLIFCLSGAIAAVIIAVLILVLINFKSYVVSSDGMFPTLRKGQLAIAVKHPYDSVGGVRRGDIICYKKVYRGDELTFTWRVLGLPGDTVVLQGTSIFINTRELNHVRKNEDSNRIIYSEYVDNGQYDVAYDLERRDSVFSIIVTKGQFFVLGDNRDHAYDSRGLGTVPFESIVGKMLFYGTR
jgi:signal peptidase I